MPIYAYKCESCGHAKDVLRKMSDPALTECPACGAATFTKQVTAAGFQLKGAGWYATDFRGSGAAPSTATATSPKEAAGKESASAGADSKPSESSASKSESAPAAAGGCAASCACH